MRMDQEDKDRYNKLAKKHGYKLAKLIREGLRVLEENENFLDPTVNPYFERIQSAQRESDQERLDDSENLKQRLTNVEQAIGNIERLLEKLALHEGLSKKDIKKAQKKDISSEAVFE